MVRCKDLLAGCRFTPAGGVLEGCDVHWCVLNGGTHCVNSFAGIVSSMRPWSHPSASFWSWEWCASLPESVEVVAAEEWTASEVKVGPGVAWTSERSLTTELPADPFSMVLAPSSLAAGYAVPCLRSTHCQTQGLSADSTFPSPSQSVVDCLSRYSFTSVPTCSRMLVNYFCAPSYISSRAAASLIKSAIRWRIFIRPSANAMLSEEDSFT